MEPSSRAPGRAVRQVDVLPQAERRQVLIDWNATTAEYPERELHSRAVRGAGERAPEAIAVVCGEQSVSYRELNERANRLAHHLRILGVRPDDRVAICAERSIEMVVGLLGALKAGGAYVPLDPEYPRERLRQILRDSEPVALLTQAGLLQGLESELRKDLPIVELSGRFEEQPETELDRAELGLTSRNLAYVIYTSGSTGLPKGVMIEHRNAANLIEWGQGEFAEAGLTRTLFSTSIILTWRRTSCMSPWCSAAQ